jgi:DNA-binding transcriptional LysR family regulator
MDFKELIYITKVADCRSITQAAKELYISQPSLSQIIQKVENELGIKLFNRATYPITLTYAGERYVNTARKILMVNEDFGRELIDICNGKKGRIRVGIPAERAVFTLPQVLTRFKDKYPGFTVNTIESDAVVLVDSLKRDVVDFIILPEMEDSLDPDFLAEWVYKEELVLVAKKGLISSEQYLDGNPDIANLAKLNNYPFIQMKKGHSIRKKTDKLLRQNKLNPQVIIETDTNFFSTELAICGYGITIVPKSAVDVIGTGKEFDCFSIGSKKVFRHVQVIYKKDTYLDNAERYFIELVKDSFRNYECS